MSSEIAKERIRKALSAFGVLYLAYLVVVNVLLVTGAIPRLLRAATEDANLELERAFSVIPFRIELRGLSLRIEDSNIQFLLVVPEGRAWVNPLHLFAKTVRFSGVRGDGVRYWFRHKVSDLSDPVTARRVASYPPIPGVAPVPLFAIGPRRPPLTDAEYNLWSVHITDVDVNASELWFQEFRYTGPARVSGAFRLKPIRRLWVLPGRVRLQGGALLVGKRTVVPSLQGTLDVHVPDFDLEPVTGREPFLFIDAKLSLRAEQTDLPLDSYGVLDAFSSETLLEADLSFVRGVLQGGSSASLRGPFEGQTRALQVSGNGSAGLLVRVPGAVESTLSISRGTATLTTPRLNADLLGLALGLTFELENLAANPILKEGNARAESVAVQDIGALAPLLGLHAARGRVAATLQGTIGPAQALAGSIRLGATGIELASKTHRFNADIQASAGYASDSLSQAGTFSHVVVDVPFSVKAENGLTEASHLQVTSDALSWRNRGTGKGASMDIHATDRKAALLNAFLKTQGFAGQFLSSQGAMDLYARLDARPGGTDICVKALRTGAVNGTGKVTLIEGVPHGIGWLSVNGLGLGLVVDGEDISVSPFRSRQWLTDQLGNSTTCL